MKGKPGKPSASGEFQETGSDPGHLRRRWNGDSVNAVVVALNEGKSLEPVLEKILGPSKSRTASGLLDLRGIDLSHQNLRGPWRIGRSQRSRTGVDLRRTDFTRAIFRWTTLPRADARESVLTQCDFRNAELLFADFTGADFSGARLEEAWMHKTALSGATFLPEQMESVRRNDQKENADDGF